MEALTRLVADSMARYGLDRPLDPRRLQWSRWSRCDSPHSLLVVPSKPGIFALAEEVAPFGGVSEPRSHNLEQSSAAFAASSTVPILNKEFLGSPALQPSDSAPGLNATRRMLAVLQFSEEDDMAFTLDRMFTRINPMRARLASGHCFLRFVVIEDKEQRRSICSALNQWILTSAEKASGIGADFSSSLEVADSVSRAAHEKRALSPASAAPAKAPLFVPEKNPVSPAPYLNSGAAKNLHCPQSLPSGF